MSNRGYSAIGLIRPKNAENVGGVLRAAHVFGASMVALQGPRTRVHSAQDTTMAHRHIPVLHSDDLFALVPFGAKPIAVDLVPDARPLPIFSHPDAAFYIFGPEDGTLESQTVSRCWASVMIPTKFCMNLAATVNVVLYDRMMKRGDSYRGSAA